MKNKTINPALSLLILFAVGITLGTVALKLPMATTHTITWLDALFTATSAMTVTGLVVLSTAHDFTLIGQLIIITLIQIGGLGIMTFAILVFLVLGKKIGFKQRLTIQFALNQTSLTGMVRLIRVLVMYSLLIEGVAALVLTLRFVPLFGWVKGFYYSAFHAISAFNNAGFALWDDSLVSFARDPLIVFTITTLILLGGLGFTVLMDLRHFPKRKRLLLHTKLMLVGTVCITLIAVVLLGLIEYQPGVPLPSQFYTAYFQAVTARTAGFNSVDMGSLADGSLLVLIVLMFIGGGSASTAGGIKVTTFIIILCTTFTFLRARKEVVVFQRTIRNEIVVKALALTTISMLWVVVVTFCLTLSEHAPFLTLLFETVSAFGTVGLSINFTAELSLIGKLLIIATMMLGKVGPLTLLFSIARAEPAKVGYPHEDIVIG